MGIANRFVADFLRGQIFRLRFFLGTLGVMGVVAGAWTMYSSMVHSANGVNTSAVLLERTHRCKAEFQPKGESRRNVAMPCEEAYALLKMAGSKKVRVTKKAFASVRFTIGNGNEHAATLEESTVQTGSLPIGGRFDAVYDPQNPSDVRAKVNWGHIQYNLLLVAGGLVLIALAFLPQVLHLFAGADGQRSVAEQSPERGDAVSWGDEAVTRALAARESRSAGSRQGIAPVAFGMRGKVAAGSRRHFGVRA